MFEAIREFRRSLSAGQMLIGCGITLTDSVVCEALGDSVDFFWIDLEHTHIDLADLKGHLIASRATGTPALVRVRGSQIDQIKPVLDIGADGIIVPQIVSAAEAEQVVNTCRYAPVGNRGFGPRAPSNYGRQIGTDYIAMANQSVFVSVQIENQSALDDIEAIAAVPGLDCIVLGPFDLSVSMGYPGEVLRDEVVQAMAHVARTARHGGKFVGMGGVDEALAPVARKIGVQWLQGGDDFSHMIREVDRLFAQLRSGF